MKKVMVKEFAEAKTYEEIKKTYVKYVQRFKGEEEIAKEAMDKLEEIWKK